MQRTSRDVRQHPVFSYRQSPEDSFPVFGFIVSRPFCPFNERQIVQAMWAEDPTKRPTAGRVVARLQGIQEELGVLPNSS